MYIESYQCKRFAGLRDIEIEFNKGLNVILGPNESGKSSIIEGIHSTLFRDIKLRMTHSKDKEFIHRFMPRPKGDFVDGSLMIKLGDGSYRIVKEWGSRENIQIEIPDGSIIRDPREAQDRLDELLNFGQATYSSIVFAKQRELKLALEAIVENREVVQEVNDLLRKTLMELDGLSIDSLEAKIEKELDNLYRRWDRSKNYPENNRGINNPYKVGLGKIIESYYEKESLRQLMEEADKNEKEFEAVSKNIRESKLEKKGMDLEKERLESIEEDINKLAILKAELGLLNRELEELREVNRDWPRGEERLLHLDTSLQEIGLKKETLVKERENIEKFKRRTYLENKIDEIRQVKKKIIDLSNELKDMGNISSEDLDQLENYHSEIQLCQSSMKAGEIFGRLIKSQGYVYINKDLDKRESLEINDEFQANGLVKINYKDEFELEIKTGQIDFNELGERYKKYREKFTEKLEELKLKDIESGKLLLREIERKKSDLDLEEKVLQSKMEDGTEEELIGELEGLKDISSTRNLDELDACLNSLNQEEIDLKSEIYNIKKSIAKWKEKYENMDNLLDIIIDKRAGHKEKEGQLGLLKPLPEDFATIEDFRHRLAYLKKETGNYQLKLEGLTEDYHEAKSRLLEDSYEEYKKAYILAEEAYERHVNRGNKLDLISRVFRETRERLDQNPLESLGEDFGRLLSHITAGKYEDGQIDEDFNIRLGTSQGLGLELLSAGTYDSVALALRFSILKHIFSHGGYLVLDDCLVDLDPLRKKQAASLIREFSKDYQVIFTTCDPETANLLEGNLIEL